MAGLPWLKVWTVVANHPKVQRLEKELRVKDGLGVVVRLWCWTADYCPGGDIPESDATAAAKFARGDTCRTPFAVMLEAFVTVGLLDRTPTGFRVHDWHDMQTVHVEAEEKRRAQAAERQRNWRERHGVTTRNGLRNALPNGDSVTEIEKEKEIEIQPASQERPAGGDEWLGEFRQKLATRLGLDALDIGKDKSSVLAFFRTQIATVGEDTVLADCVESARLSTSGVPSSLAFFVGWLKRLPTPTPEARQ